MTDYGYVHQARVVGYDAIRDAYRLESVSLARGSLWESVPSCRPGLAVGDKVIVAALGTSRDNLIIVGKVGEDFPGIGDIPGLQAALNALTAADVVLDGRLDTAESTLSSHTSSIAALVAADVALDGRLDTAEASIITDAANLAVHIADTNIHNGVRLVADVTARNALTGNYEGRIIYRLDRDWIEIYDGTAWRVRSSPAIVANTADLAAITHPYDGLIAYQTDTKAYYQYTGTGWRPFAGFGGRWTQTNAQSITNGTDTKVTFNNSLETNGISYSAGVFTIAQPGKWDLNARLTYPHTSALETWFWIGPSTGVATRWELDTRTAPTAAGGPPITLKCGIVRSFPTISDTFALWTWHSSASPKALDTSFGGTIHLEATYLGPA